MSERVRTVRLLLVAEVRLEELEDEPWPDEVSDGFLEDLAQRQLDAFREAVQPSADYGVTLYRTQFDKLGDDMKASPSGFLPEEDPPCT